MDLMQNMGRLWSLCLNVIPDSGEKDFLLILDGLKNVSPLFSLEVSQVLVSYLSHS